MRDNDHSTSYRWVKLPPPIKHTRTGFFKRFSVWELHMRRRNLPHLKLCRPLLLNRCDFFPFPLSVIRFYNFRLDFHLKSVVPFRNSLCSLSGPGKRTGYYFRNLFVLKALSEGIRLLLTTF